MKLIIFSLSIIITLLSLGILLTYDTHPALAQIESNQIIDVNPIIDTNQIGSIEIGNDFNKEVLSVNPDGTRNIKWESHYERIFDGTNWVNYQWSQTGNNIHFESGREIIDINDCILTIQDKNNTAKTISLAHKLTNNNIDVISACTISNVLPLTDTLVITTNEGDSNGSLKTQYNITATGFNEWSYNLQSLKGVALLGVKETCIDCKYEGITPTDKIIFDGIMYDTKDIEHNSLKEVFVDKNNIEITYQPSPIVKDGSFIIDPTATLTTSVDDSSGDTDGDHVCEDTGAGSYTQNNDVSAYSLTARNIDGYDCYRLWEEFDISSITDSSTVTDTDFKIEGRIIHSNINHQVYSMKDFQPSTRTAAQNFDEINDGTLLVTTTFTPLGVYNFDLTATADTEITGVLATSQNFYSIGIKLEDETLSGSVRGQTFYSASGGATVPTIIIVYTEPTAPNSPTGLTALTSEPYNTKINLSWTTPSYCGAGCTGYRIWRESPTGGGFSVLVANTSSTATTYSDTGLTQNTEYNYKVAAYNHIGIGSNSTAAAEVTWDIPNLPTALKANTQSTSQIDLSWTTPSDNGDTVITGYKIWRESPTGGGFSVLVSNTTTSATTYSSTGLTAGTEYDYKVAAWNHIGLGANATAHSNYTLTDAPTALIPTTISQSQIDLAWTAPSGTVNGYKIERESPTGGGFSTIVANTTTTATTYSNTGLSTGTEYNYKISAHNIGGTSAASTAAANTTFGGPPTNLKTNTFSTSIINMTWTAPTFCGGACYGYKIWYESPTGNGFTVLVSNTTTSTTTYNSTGLSAGIQYNYKVAAYYGGLSNNSTASANYTITNAPTALTHSLQTTTTMRTTWTAPSGTVTGYKIERETPVGGGFATIVANTANTTTHYDNTGLTAGTQYNVRISAINSGGTSATSTAVSNYTKTNAPTSLIATTISASQIDLAWTAPSGTVNGYKIERESPIGGGFSTIVANTTTTLTTYSNTLLTSNTQYNYRVSAHNMGGISAVSNQADNTTTAGVFGMLQFNENKTADAFELIPVFNYTAGSPAATVNNIIIYRNNTIVNNTAISISINIGESKQLGRTFLEQLNSGFLYNITGLVSFQSGSDSATNVTTILRTPVYTAGYIPSAEGNYQINYTYSRTNSFHDLNLVVSRQNLPANTECNFKERLFEAGTWINISNSGWYNETTSVTPTQNIYVTCYNDVLLLGFVSHGGNNATLAFVDYMNTLGTFAGVPISFLFILIFAGLFTGRSAITGVVFVSITIGVMGVMGFFPDVNGNPAIGTATWGLIVFLAGIGMFVGKKYF